MLAAAARGRSADAPRGNVDAHLDAPRLLFVCILYFRLYAYREGLGQPFLLRLVSIGRVRIRIRVVFSFLLYEKI